MLDLAYLLFGTSDEYLWHKKGDYRPDSTWSAKFARWSLWILIIALPGIIGLILLDALPKTAGFIVLGLGFFEAIVCVILLCMYLNAEDKLGKTILTIILVIIGIFIVAAIFGGTGGGGGVVKHVTKIRIR